MTRYTVLKMAPIDQWQPKSDSVKQLLENKPTDFLDASEILINISSNIIKYPEDGKYRKVVLADRDVENKLLPIHGAMTCLFEMGFVEDGDCLSLPAENSIAAVKHIHQELTTAKEKIAKRSDRMLTEPVSHGVTIPVTRLRPEEARFLAKLRASYRHVMIYEDVVLQQKARDHLPMIEIKERAKCLMNESEANTGDRDIERDFLVMGLLDWFKRSFFSWVNVPACCACGAASCTLVGQVDPLPSELRWGGNRVEDYVCERCRRHTRFPRYNHPEKLLETRCGRCGEWANCFSLLCVALGYDTRYVLDWTDHVWTEVFSESQQRWLHCDPCENVCDKPLLYENGWGKKLTYVVAFSKDDIQDVTWRYSKCHRDTLARRSECRESWLVQTIVKLRDERLEHGPPDRRAVVHKRLVHELVEFLSENTSEEKLGGRTTGSLAWRKARGELGDEAVENGDAYVFTLNAAEVTNKCFHLHYSCSKDVYVRSSDTGSEIKGWRNCVFESERIYRKVEDDWNMAYLARKENKLYSTIMWKFDFTGSGLTIDTVLIRASSTCYESGSICWTLCDGDTCMPLHGDGYQTVTELYGCTGFKLTAHLQGGAGDNAWQHTQLFRQDVQSQDFPLDIKISFRSHN